MLKKVALLFVTLLISLFSVSPALVAADAAPLNLIPNPSVETSADGTTPDGWTNYGDPSATSTFSYVNGGHTDSKSVEIQTTAVTTGGSDWYYADVPVVAGQSYQYSNWYKSDVDTELDAEVIVNGVAQYFWVGAVTASSDWSQATATFTAPAGATNLSIYPVLTKVGTLTTDDYSLVAYTPTPFTRGMVSVTFDDGWANQYANAYPFMKNLGLPATYYIISGELTDQPEYMSAANVLDLHANGNEIGSHTVHHCDLTGGQTDDPDNCPLTIGAVQIQNELANSQTTLQNLIGAPVTDFAYPYGAFNAATIATAKNYYASQRDVTAGFNTKDSLDATKLKMYEVDSNITPAQVQAWIDEANVQHYWLILTYHEVATTPSDPTDDLYTTQPADFQTEMTYLKNSGVAVETVNQALGEATGQTTTTLKAGDANGDNNVDVLDLSILASHWATLSGATRAQGDLNNDGKVDVLDLSILASNWGK